MKYIFGIFIFFLVIFIVYAGLIIFKSKDGVFDVCIYKFEECALAEGKNDILHKTSRIFSCSNKVFVCNTRALYHSFTNEKLLDDEYNDYLINRLQEEIDTEKKDKKMNSDNKHDNDELPVDSDRMEKSDTISTLSLPENDS